MKLSQIKKSLIIIILLIVVVIAVWALVILVQKPKEQTIPTIRIGYNPKVANHAPMMVAKNKGFLENRGFKVEYFPFARARESCQALATNRIDIAFAAPAPRLSSLIDQGVPIKIIAASTNSRIFLVTRSDFEIQQLKDLQDKTFGLTVGGSNELILRLVFENIGLDPTKAKVRDVKKSYYGIALLEKKMVDGIITTNPQTSDLLSRGAVINQEWKDNEKTKTLWPANAMAARQEFIEENPQLVKEFLKGYRQAFDFINEYPDETAVIVAQEITQGTDNQIIYTPEAAKADMANKVYTPWANPQLVIDLDHIAKQFNILTKELTLEDVYDIRFKEILTE